MLGLHAQVVVLKQKLEELLSSHAAVAAAGAEEEDVPVLALHALAQAHI